MTGQSTPCVRLFGMRLTGYTFDQTLQRIDELVAARKPSFFVTANLHYAALSADMPVLREINSAADFIVADGMPLVWGARLQGVRLPGRVTGSDLIFRLSAHSAQKGYRLYFYGAGPGVAERAANELRQRYPGLQVVGTETPPFRPLTRQELEETRGRIRDAKPDIVLVAFSQPKGDLWLWENYREIGAPVTIQVGASFDFAAGKISRAPKWMQRTGFEWAFRIFREPVRLAGRYAGDFGYLLRWMIKERRRNREYRGRVISPSRSIS